MENGSGWHFAPAVESSKKNYLIEQRKQVVFINIFKPLRESLGIPVSKDLSNYPIV
jgi:hypothetical protein